MPLRIEQFPVLADNYAYLVRDEASGRVACIDTPDAEAIAAALRRLGWTLDLILNTHWHPDHAGGNAALQAGFGCAIYGPQEVARIAPLDHPVTPGQTVEVGSTSLLVMDVGGHTLQHVAYFAAADRIAFVGDSLFPLGCGRMFEGDAVQMWGGLQRLAALPDDTRLYCAHEYTAANARFALSVDDDPALRRRADQVFAARDRGEPTVPSTVGEEKATNPFLRAPLLAGRVGAAGLSDPEAFAALRRAKDGFKG